MEATKKKYLTHGISWPDPELLARAQARAKRERRKFSDYVRGLIEADLAKEARQLETKARRKRSASFETTESEHLIGEVIVKHDAADVPRATTSRRVPDRAPKRTAGA